MTFFILHPSAFHPYAVRDGVTGNTSGFEPEDGGSIPSPAATLTRRQEQEAGAREAAAVRGEIFSTHKGYFDFTTRELLNGDLCSSDL